MEQKVNFSEEEQKFFTSDNNYIEYFFEVGIKPDIFKDTTITPDLNLEKINSKLSPEIISKFPYFDKKPLTIDSTIIDFIFPKEFKAIEGKTAPNSEYYTVILDNPFYSLDYSYKYIGCLVIYESLNIYKKIYDNYANDSEKQNDDFKNIFIPKCLCLASVNPDIKKFELILEGIYDLIMKGKNYFIDDIIERLICQTPKIPRGIKKIMLKIDDKNIDLTEKKLNELTTVNVNLKILFSSFKIEKIVEIFKLMLYETKMIFFSTKKGEITNYILSFILLLKPFIYQYRILSILPQKFYYFLVVNNHGIYGVNELYTQNFFTNNNLNIGNELTCIVDLDKKDYYLLNKPTKNLPGIPKHLKEKLDKRTEEYKKSKKKTGDKDEDYQEIFYRFMINLLKDYPKFLKKNSTESTKLKDMFDNIGFINSQSTGDKSFFEKIIYSQMFADFIEKRLIPRDPKEKINALFFEEKLNVKYAQKKIFGGNKILGQNVLLSSKDFDYEKNPEIIDLIGNSPYTKLDNETINFFSKENINKEICLPRGYKVREGNTKKELYFDYYLFPTLLSEELFKYNCKNYIVPNNYILSITKMSEFILNNCFIKFDETLKNKSGELLNDIYISYLILFSICLSYMDKEERKVRFSNLLQILLKIDKHDIEVIELFFNCLIQLKEEELAVHLYTLFNQMHINLSWGIFLIMSKILHNGQEKYSAIMKDIKYGRASSVKSINRIPQNITKNENKFRKRSIKLPGIDDGILGEQIFFDVFGVCLNCKININLEKICEELSPKDLDKNNNRFKCRCGDWNLQKLNFKIGTELYNNNITTNHSSLKEGVILYSPTNLRKKLKDISMSLNGNNFDVNNFRLNYPEEFWNSIWYFKLKELDISFMLPYISPIYINKTGKENNINNFLKFVFEEEKDDKPICNNKIKNPNTEERIIIKKDKEGKEIEIKKEFNAETLFIQSVYQIAIFKIVGLVIYKPTQSYRGNISIKGNVLKVTYTKKKIQKKFEKKSKSKNKDNILFSNNIITSDFDLTTSMSTTNVDKSEEKLLNLRDRNSNAESENTRKTKVRFSNEELFENIREDDENYYKFKEYKEDDLDYF